MIVWYKGGGAIRGPQSSGLILGPADWVAECRANAFPNRAIGRAMKICKEEVVGLAAAVVAFIAEDEAAKLRCAPRSIVVCRRRLPSVQRDLRYAGDLRHANQLLPALNVH